MREMTGPVSWLEAGWQSLPSAEAPVGGTRANLFRRSQKTTTIVEASDSGGAAPDSHRLPLLHGPLISFQLSHEAYHRPQSPRKSALRAWSAPSTLPS